MSDTKIRRLATQFIWRKGYITPHGYKHRYFKNAVIIFTEILYMLFVRRGNMFKVVARKRDGHLNYVTKIAQCIPEANEKTHLVDILHCVRKLN